MNMIRRLSVLAATLAVATLGAGGMVLSPSAAFASAATAQTATLSPASTVGAYAPMRPAYTAKLTLTVRCGKFVGEVDHGGNGGLIDPAYLVVKGKLSSSCNSTTYLEVQYDVLLEGHYGPTTIGRAGARKTVNVDWQTKSVFGTFSGIAVRVGTTDGMPKGKIFWAQWKHV